MAQRDKNRLETNSRRDSDMLCCPIRHRRVVTVNHIVLFFFSCGQCKCVCAFVYDFWPDFWRTQKSFRTAYLCMLGFRLALLKHSLPLLFRVFGLHALRLQKQFFSQSISKWHRFSNWASKKCMNSSSNTPLRKPPYSPKLSHIYNKHKDT